MKVTLDLTNLRESGLITSAEYEKLLQLGRRGTGSLGINILVGFGVMAVSGGLIALLPNPYVVMVLGAVLFAAGFALLLKDVEEWSLLAQICLVTGALMVCGGIAVIEKGSLRSLVIITLLLASGSIVARSSLLMAGAVVGLAACLGARTGYVHARYSLAIYEPLLTIIVFSVLALATYQVSKRVTASYERIAITAARTSVLLVNFGFWIGSLWGDRLTWLATGAHLPRWFFVVGWALALFAVGAWAVSAERRWVVNAAAVFGAIHFYTQWFELLGAHPASVLLGGIVMLGIAFALWRFNRGQPLLPQGTAAA
jgi:iron complex transport system permease protein